MSTEEQQKLIGRLFLEHREAKQQVDILAVRLRGLGQTLLTIIQQLAAEQFAVAHENIRRFRSEEIDLAAIAALLAEYEDATRRMNERADELARLK